MYVQDTAARAVENFFKPQNLTALRELTLRRAAEAHRRGSRWSACRPTPSKVRGRRANASWLVSGRIPISPTIVRTAKRLADLMDAPWMAVTVERPAAT